MTLRLAARRLKDLPLPRVPLTPSALRSAGLPALAMVGLLLTMLAVALWAAWRWLEPIPASRRLVLATGPGQSAYEAFGRRYQPLLAAQGVQIELRPTGGARDNLALLADPDSGVHAAFVQSGMAAPEGAPPLASLGTVALEPLWVFYRRASVPALRLPRRAAPTRLTQLAPWRIDIGAEGGGSATLMRQLASDQGLPPSSLVPRESAAVQRVLALVQGEVDALALVSAADAPFVRYLLATPEVALLDFAQAQAAARRLGHLQPLVMPRGVIDPAADRPPRDLQMVAATASLVVRSDLHPALMQLLMQTAQTVHGGSGWFQREREFPRPEGGAWDLAETAERHYREGPPWLQRHLSFWLATFVDRMWIVLLPLLAALVPLSRLVPPLVTMRLRSRIYRWYADLRQIEAAVEQPRTDLRDLAQRLDRLDHQTGRIAVPLPFTGELYDLRAHINLVRKRLQVQMASPPGQEPGLP
jgi:TRAP-type uncharacterized transport system substrate-binding protein